MRILLSSLVIFILAISSIANASENNMHKEREIQAIEAIKEAYDKKGHEYDVTLFVSHHLQVISASYWQNILGTSTPTPSQILSSLILRNKWSSEGDEIYDFTLPNDVTSYVLSVRFNVSGNIEEISMES